MVKMDVKESKCHLASDFTLFSKKCIDINQVILANYFLQQMSKSLYYRDRCMTHFMELSKTRVKQASHDIFTEKNSHPTQ